MPISLVPSLCLFQSRNTIYRGSLFRPLQFFCKARYVTRPVPYSAKACCSACVLHSKSHADQSSFLTPVVSKDCMLKILHISCTHNWWDNSLIWFNWLCDSTNSFLIWITQTITWHQGTKITTSNQHYTPGWKTVETPNFLHNVHKSWMLVVSCHPAKQIKYWIYFIFIFSKC